MDTPSANDPLGNANDITSELGHITQEIYKKNTQLAQTNKTLSLLRKIDEIILSSLTDPKQVTQNVVTLAAKEADFPFISIFLSDKKQQLLSLLALSETDTILRIEQNIKTVLREQQLPMTTITNPVVQTVQDRTMRTVNTVHDVLLPSYSLEEADSIQLTVGIAAALVYPIIVRDTVIGVMVVGVTTEISKISSYQKDLIERLVDVIGIAIDNALLYQEIQAANEKLQQLDKLKDEFVSLASHELRTPMTAIKSYLWMALAGKGGPLSEKQKYYLDRSYNSTVRLITLVNDMLNVSRIESGRITLEVQVVNIDILVSEVIAELLPRAQELGINLAHTASPALPTVLADENKVKQVLINLIGNALKFTPKGGSITINSVQNGGMVETSVVDTGEGIAPEQIQNLFQKFGIVGNSNLTKQNAQGSGLGLYISKAIIELHGGKIAAFSKGKGTGTTFTFSLKEYNETDAKNINQSQIGKPKAELIPSTTTR